MDSGKIVKFFGEAFAVVLDVAPVTFCCRFLKYVGKRWLWRFLLLLVAVTPVTAQTITFYAVPPNATVQCISNAPATLLSITGVIPFGIVSSTSNTLSSGSVFDVDASSIGTGQAGKIDLCNYPNSGAWAADMTTNGCNCTVSVGAIPVITGNAQVSQAFNAMGAGAIVITPLVDQFGFSGTGTANIVGFMVAQIVNTTGSGSSWHATFEVLSGPSSPPNVMVTSSCGSIFNLAFHETSPNGNTNVIIRTWTATDWCVNSATATQLVTVVDHQPPFINCPGNIVTNTTGTNGVVVTFAVTATDNCDGSVPVSCSPAS